MTGADVDRDSGTAPGIHVSIMVAEVLRCLRPRPGEVAVDCTLGGGGHARAILDRVLPGGRVVAFDVDPVELERTDACLRAGGVAPDALVARHGNFADLPHLFAAEGLTTVDMVLADLGVSSMQRDDPARGFGHKGVGPLDMRMNRTRGEPASALLARVSESELAGILAENADEPHAAIIARLLKQTPPATTHAAERTIRIGLTTALPRLSKPDVKMSIRRTFQALRIAVNDEFAALDALLRALPSCLSPGGRVAMITFHSGEDRRVKKAFQAGLRAGIYAQVAREVIRSSKTETRANRRASAAKLRWAVTA
jgi:16S rRNA (cytosine1402-N4)-methyltransferase